MTSNSSLLLPSPVSSLESLSFLILSTLAYLITTSSTNTNSASTNSPSSPTLLPPTPSKSPPQSTYISTIGSTPLHLLPHTSTLLSTLTTKVHLLVKLELLNPGGTGKDRPALNIITSILNRMSDHEYLHTITEGSSGSTGIALVSIAKPLGIEVVVCIPDDQSQIKKDLITMHGGVVNVVKCVSISNPNHYVNTARRLANDIDGRLMKEWVEGGKKGKRGRAVFTDQFENTDNYKAHYTTTGPEILKQCYEYHDTYSNQSPSFPIDSFVMSSGTGGTISGVSNYIKDKLITFLYSQKTKPHTFTSVLSDCQGSVLSNSINTGCAFTIEQTERTLQKNRYDTICEGIGLDRLTANFKLGRIDRGEKVADKDVLWGVKWLLSKEGMFCGSSSGCNFVAAVREVKRLVEINDDLVKRGEGEGREGVTVVTIICDSGGRHLGRLWNQEYVEKACGVEAWPGEGVSEGEWEAWVRGL